MNDIINKESIEHFVIPFRDFNLSSKSRFIIDECTDKECDIPGGFTPGITTLENQLTSYHEGIANYLFHMIKFDIPTILILILILI